MTQREWFSFARSFSYTGESDTWITTLIRSHYNNTRKFMSIGPFFLIRAKWHRDYNPNQVTIQWHRNNVNRSNHSSTKVYVIDARITSLIRSNYRPHEECWSKMLSNISNHSPAKVIMTKGELIQPRSRWHRQNIHLIISPSQWEK